MNFPEIMATIVRKNGKREMENDDKQCICAETQPFLLYSKICYMQRGKHILYMKPGIHCHFNRNSFHFNHNMMSSYFPFTCNGNKSQHVRI